MSDSLLASDYRGNELRPETYAINKQVTKARNIEKWEHAKKINSPPIIVMISYSFNSQRLYKTNLV